MSMNTVVLMGRISNEIELSETRNGKVYTRFSIACDSKYKRDETNFIPCVAWGKNAEFIGKYFAKGRMIAVEGELESGKYEKDGRTVYTYQVNVARASFTGERADSGQVMPEWEEVDEDVPF